MSEGWIKLHRQIFSSEIWFDKPAWWLKVWIYINLKVNHTEKFKLKTGESRFTYGMIYEDCKLSNEEVKKHSVSNVIKYLKNSKMITTRKTTRGFIITVCNYKTYQDKEIVQNHTVNDMGNDTGTTQERHRNDMIYKNEKNYKNEKKKKRPAMPALIVIPHLKNPEFEELWKDFIAHRREIGKPMTNRSQNMQLKMLEPFPLIQAIHEMKRSIAGGWQGIHPPQGSLAEPPMSAEEHMRLQGPRFRYVESN